MSAFIQSISLFFRQIFFEWGDEIIYQVGFFASLTGNIFSFVKEPTSKAVKAFIIIIPIFLSAILSIGRNYSEKRYTSVPSFHFNQDSVDDAYSKLDNASLWHSDEHIVVDESSKKYLKNGEDLTNHALKVTDCNPKPGTIVKKETIVTLYAHWSDEIETRNLNDPLMENFDRKEFYGNPNVSALATYNTLDIKICAQPAALKELIGDAEKSTTVYPSLAMEDTVKIQLIDYASNEIVDQAICYLGDEITFPNIQTGIYYFTVSCDGYQTALSENPFCLDYDSSEPEYSPCWYIPLEKTENAYCPPFKIRLQDKQGNPLSNTTVNMYVNSEDDTASNTTHWSPSFKTDKDGYLCNEEGNYLLPGGIVEFQVLDGYFIQIFFDNKNETPVRVDPMGSDEACVIM